MAYLTAATHGLREESENIKTEFNLDADKIPAVNPNARLLRPAVPVLPNEGNWPLLTVTKSVFEGAVGKGKVFCLSLDTSGCVHSQKHAVAAGLLTSCNSLVIIKPISECVCLKAFSLHSQKLYRLDASYRFYKLDGSLSSSRIKPVVFIKLHQACCLHQVATSV